jgi:hypothetical protein
MADYIIALDGSGGIAEQGNLAELRSRENGIFEHLKSISQDVDIVHNDSPKTEEASVIEEVLAPLELDNGGKKRRQQGDLSIYVYWFKTIGAKYIIAFYTTLVIIEGLQVGSGKQTFRVNTSVSNNNRCLACPMDECKQHQ